MDIKKLILFIFILVFIAGCDSGPYGYGRDDSGNSEDYQDYLNQGGYEEFDPYQDEEPLTREEMKRELQVNGFNFEVDHFIESLSRCLEKNFPEIKIKEIYDKEFDNKPHKVVVLNNYIFIFIPLNSLNNMESFAILATNDLNASFNVFSASLIPCFYITVDKLETIKNELLEYGAYSDNYFDINLYYDGNEITILVNPNRD